MSISSRQALAQLQAIKLHFNPKTPVLHPSDSSLLSRVNYLPAVRQRLQQAAHDSNWQQVQPQDWTAAAWLLGRTATDLIADADFMQQLALQLKQHPQANLILKRLIYSYFCQFCQFCQFQPESEYQTVLAELIITALTAKTKHQDAWLKNWKQQQRKYHIFTQPRGIEILAQHCLRRGGLEFLPSLGFKGHLLRSAYITAVYARSLDKLASSKNELLYMQFLAWSQAGAYPLAKNLILTKLLTNWQKHNPSNELKSALQQFAVQNYGDPRYQTWRGLPIELNNLCCEWLIADTIMAFAQILAEVDKYWQYRQEFWWSYYQQGHIEQAWLILANGVREQTDLAYPHLQYANLIGSGIRSQHCVLLLKIKDLIIADWSHQGRCHIWLPQDANAPEFYAAEYNRQQLSQGSAKIKAEYSYNGINHHNSEGGGWQTDVTNFIKIYI